MILSQNDTMLPDWVKEHMMMTCPHCGSPIASNHDTGVLTERWCSNEECPGHMAYRIVYLAQYYNMEGWGPATALKWIKLHKPYSHLEILKEWFKTKPTEPLSRIADLACVKDFGLAQAQAVLDQFASFKEFFDSEISEDYPVLCDNAGNLLIAQSYFEVKKPMLGQNVYVMATGSIHGFTNRDAFFEHLNELIGDIIHVVQVGARKTNVSCLIKEEDAVDHKKSRIAKEAGIPILTSQQFTNMILKAYKEAGGNLDELQCKIEK